MDFSEGNCFALFKGETEKSEVVYYLDEVSLDGLTPGTKPSTSFLSNLPSWFKGGVSLSHDQGSNIYVCGGQGFARFNLETHSWEKLQKPIGDLGEERPWLSGIQSSIFLLSGKPKSGDSSLTNHIQVNSNYFLCSISRVYKYILYYPDSMMRSNEFRSCEFSD